MVASDGIHLIISMEPMGCVVNWAFLKQRSLAAAQAISSPGRNPDSTHYSTTYVFQLNYTTESQRDRLSLQIPLLTSLLHTQLSCGTLVLITAGVIRVWAPVLSSTLPGSMEYSACLFSPILHTISCGPCYSHRLVTAENQFSCHGSPRVFCFGCFTKG